MAGVAKYLKYATWEEMLASFTKERDAQGIEPLNESEKQPHTILYKQYASDSFEQTKKAGSST